MYMIFTLQVNKNEALWAWFLPKQDMGRVVIAYKKDALTTKVHV